MRVPEVLAFFLFWTLSPRSCIPQGLSPGQQPCPECTGGETKTRFLIKEKTPAFVVFWVDGRDAFSAWGAPGMLGGGRWGWWRSGPRRGGEPRYAIHARLKTTIMSF